MLDPSDASRLLLHRPHREGSSLSCFPGIIFILGIIFHLVVDWIYLGAYFGGQGSSSLNTVSFYKNVFIV